MSLERIREWMRANPENAEELRRQNRSFVFFRIVGLSDEREAAQDIPLTPGRSIAVDGLLHVYGTPFFLQAGLPLTAGSKSIRFDRLMIAQDTGSAIVGPARADVFWGAGEEAGRVAGEVHHRATFAMLVPREVDPVVAGTRMPLPPEKPSLTVEANATTSLPASLVQARRLSQADEFGRNLRPQSRQQSGCSETSGPRSKLHVWTSRAESAWPIYDPDYRRRRLQAACKAASNQRGRQPCLLGLRSNRGTKGLGHLAPGELIQSCVGLSATLQSIMRCSFLGNNSERTSMCGVVDCCTLDAVMNSESWKSWKSSKKSPYQGVVKRDWVPTGRIDFAPRSLMAAKTLNQVNSSCS